ncbi:hypothetical protein [Dactylosporangium matsuzakiense]|uniref:Uncharacterized protein n=1 Tax=Dactylosporangium matsuzakiense TaxID=53360 RepID=A0A9W6NM99_9ACTN|nr:hypothetical protein [Dactylosporangium matsuzakiense]UWZ46746.1 hypothetical protein Dmats_10175 [Dactylosporangium matsuzakiense]GLL01707.1 hypothetical protein GCM10017581_034490 [Dactylosporangium matsuzakiense]
MQAARPEFETEVLTAFSAKLREYCDHLLRSRGAEGIGPVLVVSVVTAIPVPALRKRLDDLAVQMLGRRLPGARLDRMFFAVDQAMSEPMYAIGVEERPPVERPADDEAARLPVQLLTLSFGRPHKFVFGLEARAAWVPIRRGLPTAGARREIALPEYLSMVPRGVLLELRYSHGRVELRRTEDRPEYHVEVDQSRLDRGQSIALGPRGGIAFRNGGGQAELRYVLMERL